MGLANYTPTSYKDTAPSDTLGLLPELTTTATPNQSIAMDAVTEAFPLHAIKQYDKLQQNVIDGDTIRGDQFGLPTDVRISGYNAPEMPDKQYKDEYYVDAALAGTTTPEQMLGLEAKRDLITNTFEMQKLAGLAEAKDRKLVMHIEGYDKGGQRLLGGIYRTDNGKVVDDVSTRMLSEGDSNVWFAKNDQQAYEKTIVEKQLLDQALSTAQNSNSDNDWARYENLVQRSGLSTGEKDVYLKPKFQIAKPIANAIIGAGELTSKAGNLALELIGNPRGMIQSAYKSGIAEIEGDDNSNGYVFDNKEITKDSIAKSTLLDTVEKFTKAPNSKDIEKAFTPIREQLNKTFNTTVFSELRPAEAASVAKAVHDWEKGREGAGAIGIANAVFSGLINEENAAMLIPGAGMPTLVLGKAKEFEDSGASKEKALAYGAMYSVLNKVGLHASIGQVKNLANLAAGRFVTNSGLELLTENAQSILELDAAGKIKSIKDVEQSLRQTTLETLPNAVFGGTTGLVRDSVNTDDIRTAIKGFLSKPDTAIPTSGNQQTINDGLVQVYDIGTRLQSGEPVTIDDYNKLDAYEKQHQGATDTDIIQSLKQTAGMKKALLKKLETSTPEDIQGFMMGSKAIPTAIIEAIADFNPESRSALLAKLEQAEVISKELSAKLEKSFADVETDATDSLRGYKTYGAILEELSKNPEANADAIAEYKGKVANYLDTQVSYVDKMTAAINYVNKVITSANPDAATDVKVTYDTVNGKQVVGTVKYEVPDLKQANGKPYVLTVNRTFGPGGKSIYVSPATDTILAKKNENIAALQKILDGTPGEVVSPRLQKQTATVASVSDLDGPVIEDTNTPWEEVGDDTAVVTEPVVETKPTPKQEKTATVKTKTSKITVTAVPKGDSRLGGALANRKYVQEGLTKKEVIDYVLGKGDTKTSVQKKAMVDYMKRAFGRDIVKELNSMDEQTIRKFVILHEAGHENYSDTTESYFADTRQRIAKHLKVADAGNKYLSDSAIRTEARATEYALNELGKASLEERKSDVLPWETTEEYLTRSLAENAKDMPAKSTEPVDTAAPTETKKAGTTTIGQKLRNKFNELGGAKNTLVAYAKTLAKILASTRPNDAEQIKTVIDAQVAEIVGDDATRPSAVISKALGKVRASKEGKTGNDLAMLNAAEKELVAELAASKEFETEERATGKQATDALLNNGAKRKTKKGEAETKSVASILLTSTKAGMRGLLALSDEMTDKLGEQVAKMKASLAAILAKSSGLNYAWLGDSPSRLLYDNYGMVPEKVAEAMTIVSIDFMAQAAGDLSVNTREDVVKWLGIQNPATVTVKVMRDIGKLEQLLATGLGAKVLKLLGVTVPADAPASLKPRLEADLGATLLRAMVEQGILEELQVIDTNTIETLKGIGGNKKEMGAFVMPDTATLENPLTTFRLSADAKVELAKSQAIARELHKQLVKEMKEDATSTGPRTTKTNGNKVFKAKNVEDVTTVSKYTNEVLNIAENTPFTAHEAAKVLAGVFGKNRNYDDRTAEQQELLELFGYVDTAAETTEVHVDKREDVEADNRTLFRKLSYFTDHIDNFGDVEVYFNYFVSKNGRLFIDSATVNPQTDKIARFILTVKTGDNVVTDKHIDTFKLGVVQAFDGGKFVMPGEADAVVVDEDGIELVDLGAIDKQSTAKSIKDFDRVMADTAVKAAVQSIQDGKPDNALIMEVIKDTKHPTHAMAALYELAKYTKADGGEFETSLVIEVDGVTSGVFLGHILNPVISDYTKLKGALTRGGMFFGDDAGKTYGEWKELGGTDTYQVGIPVIKERLAGIEFKNHKAIQALVEINRAFMKNPLMVFFYGAGRASIKDAISDAIADEVIANLSKNDLTDAYKAKVIAVMVDKRDAHLRTAKESDKANVKAFNANKAEQLDKAIKWLSDKNTTAKVIRNTSMAGNKGNLAAVYAAVHSETHDTVAAATVDYLDKEYGEVRKAQEAMNFVFKGAFGVFKKHYDKEMIRVVRSKATVPTKATLSETGYVVKTQEQISKLTDAAILKQLDSGALQATNADVDAVLKTLMNKGLVPGILTVDGEGVAEKAAIIKRDKTSLATEKDVNGKTVAKETYKTVQLHLGNSNKQKVVNPLIYQWLANPVAGGVTNVHYFDSAMIQRIVRDASGLGVHDAWVANVTKAVAAGYTYNEAIWIASQKFDMLGDVLQQFVNLTNNKEDRNAFMAELFDKDHMDKRQDAFGELAGLTTEEYKEWFMAKLQNTLVVSVNNSRINKQKLANETFALSQMAGPKGIEYNYKPAETKEVVGSYMEWADDVELLGVKGVTQRKSAIITKLKSMSVVPEGYKLPTEKAMLSRLTLKEAESLQDELTCTA